MGPHPQSARRVALAAASAAVVSCVLVGVGVGVGTAEEAPAAVSRAVEAPRVPAAVPAAEPAPEPVTPRTAPPTTPTATATPEAEPRPAAEPEPVPEPEPADTAPAAAGSERAAPRASLPVRAAAPALVPGTPCTVTAKACADLGSQQAWLIENGAVRRGPVPIMIGDEIDPTPVGTFAVEWKAEAWTSREYLVQMPYSVFFAEGGIAFHEGNQQTPSAGCIKLDNADAKAWFDYLKVGDEVQVR